MQENSVPQFILKEKLEELIDGQKVHAVMFYSFNFDPIFFENYVMPLFVQEANFSDLMIYNKILWRKYQKEDKIPAITVYCDYYAKATESAPSLGYDINCIQVPNQKNYICNFHPKHIFILVDVKGAKASHSEKRKKLIMVTGSGNITPSGWCDNFECFSIQEIFTNKVKPNSVKRNTIQKLIFQTKSLTISKGNGNIQENFSDDDLEGAERKINDFLKFVDTDDDFVQNRREKNKAFYYHNSLFQNFNEFIKTHIPEKETIHTIEIVSPYFSSDISLLSLLNKELSNPTIHILVPRLKSNQVNLLEESFKKMKVHGVHWCNWANPDLNKEVRDLHAKMYRFHGDKKVYTVIGSVNFTNPAWKKFNKMDNQSNIESAELFIESDDKVYNLLSRLSESEIEKLEFVPVIKEDLEFLEENTLDRNAPHLEFTLDWKEKTLFVQSEKKKDMNGFHYHNLFENCKVRNNQLLKLSDVEMKVLSSNSIIKLEKVINDRKCIYSYYPNHKNIEVKPFEFKLSALQILQLWQKLNQEEKAQQDLLNLIQHATNESGVFKDELLIPVSILNEMASYFNALIDLEKFLFPQKDPKKLEELTYYLFHENIDTIPFYLKTLEQEVEQGKHKNLYWMVLQIIINNIYDKAKTMKFKTEDEEVREFKLNVAKQVKYLKKRAAYIAQEIPGMESKQVQDWVIKEIKRKEYA